MTCVPGAGVLTFCNCGAAVDGAYPGVVYPDDPGTRRSLPRTWCRLPWQVYRGAEVEEGTAAL